MRTRIALVTALCVVAAMAAAALAAQQQPTRSVVLGKTPNYPAPGCPTARTCEVVARVTGIQMTADGVAHPFRAPTRGNIVAWWLKLPKLRSAQYKAFSQLFGGRPQARLAIVRRGKRARFRLVRQSPTIDVTPYLGKKGRARFKLAEPLFVKEGDYVALTAITWVPAFAVGLDPTSDVWLASRPKDRCQTPPASDTERFAAYYKHSDAHTRASTVKRYRCNYQTARLLYWARLVPEPSAPQAPTK
jgi:hypothetical protein